MSTAWQGLGLVKWPLSLSVLVLLALVAWASLKVFGRDGPDPQTKVWIDAILFWGGFAALSGVLGTLAGITLAAQSIEAAGEISTVLVWGGIKVAMVSSVLGVLIMLMAGMVWFVLQLRWRLLQARAATAG